MQRHFKIQTLAGLEDIYCTEVDDTKPDEIWFIFNDRPPKIFQKAAIISIQEVPLTDPDDWNKFARKMIVPPTYRKPR